MKSLICALVNLFFASISLAASSDKIDVSDTFLSLLDVSSNSLSMVSVENTIKNSDPSIHSQDCDITVYKIFGSSLNEFSVLQRRYKMTSVYNGVSLSNDVIYSSKEFLMGIAENYPNENIRSMAYASLGVVFFDDEVVAQFLLCKYLDGKTKKEEKGLILEALSYCFDGKNDSIAEIAFKICLQSKDEEVRGYAATILVENSLCKQRFLSDLLASAITAEPSFEYSKKLKTLLLTYDKILLEKYRPIIQQSIDANPENKLLVSLFAEIWSRGQGESAD